MSHQTTPHAEPREAVVHGSANGFAQEITVGRHHLVADEPAAAGGTDTGPGPYDLLISALGACTSMTVSLYARRKQWPLEAVTVKLRHAKIHAADCEDCEKKGAMIDRIERDVELHGALSDEQRQRLLDIANKCPVHRTLTSKIDIRTRLVAGFVVGGGFAGIAAAKALAVSPVDVRVIDRRGHDLLRGAFVSNLLRTSARSRTWQRTRMAVSRDRSRS